MTSALMHSAVGLIKQPNPLKIALAKIEAGVAHLMTTDAYKFEAEDIQAVVNRIREDEEDRI